MREHSLGNVFEEHRSRLRLGVHLRMDARLAGRLDASDIIQDAFLEATERYEEYLRDPRMPLFVWLRFITMQKLAFVHRHHLGVKARTAEGEISLNQVPHLDASSAALAAQLVGRLSTPSHAAIRAETQMRLSEALSQMPAADREILALRHFEHVTNAESAQVLGLRESTTSMRYARALLRLKEVLMQFPGLKSEVTP